MMQFSMRANKNSLFAEYMNKEPRTVIPAEAGIQALQLKKKPLDARLRGHDEALMFFLKDLSQWFKIVLDSNDN